jgi:hypothetical protein
MAIGNGEKLSWYPQPAAWNSKAEETGLRWTEWNEKWLRKRDQEILLASDLNDPKWSDSQPKSSNAWLLKINSFSKKFDTAYERLARDFLMLFVNQ